MNTVFWVYSKILLTNNWYSIKIIDKINPKVDMLFMCAEKDELVNSVMSSKLYDKCVSNNKLLIKFAKGTHNNTFTLNI